MAVTINNITDSIDQFIVGNNFYAYFHGNLVGEGRVRMVGLISCS